MIDLAFIILNCKSKDLNHNFVNLLSNIYCFSFNYENMMTPMLRQYEPLFTNINKKNLKQLNYDLNLSDFSIFLLNSLIKKENEILT